MKRARAVDGGFEFGLDLLDEEQRSEAGRRVSLNQTDLTFRVRVSARWLNDPPRRIEYPVASGQNFSILAVERDNPTRSRTAGLIVRARRMG